MYVCIGVCTCADQRAVIIQCSQVGSRQGQEGVEFTEVTAESGSGQHRADDDVPQRVSDETGKKEAKMFSNFLVSIHCKLFLHLT